MADVREAICKSTILKKYFALKSGDLGSHWMSPKREIILLGSLPVVQEHVMLIRPLFLSYTGSNVEVKWRAPCRSPTPIQA